MSLAHLGSRMAVGRGLALSTKSRLPRLPAGHAHSTSAVQVFCAAQESSRMEGGRSSAAEKLIRGHIAAATTVGGLLLSEASPALAQDAGPAGGGARERGQGRAGGRRGLVPAPARAAPAGVGVPRVCGRDRARRRPQRAVRLA
ncbi:hypothetical protein ACKKBG_A33560 [Auxenochlorella protothecoides x Auxenochlorella symbiontica]